MGRKQLPENRKACRLRKRTQPVDGVSFIHLSRTTVQSGARHREKSAG
jgi:hypothetical protein